jgi:hypothetical protein
MCSKTKTNQLSIDNKQKNDNDCFIYQVDLDGMRVVECTMHFDVYMFL